jgi:hypothetical protein
VARHAAARRDGGGPAGFVALDPVPLLRAASPDCRVVELAGVDGATLVIRLAGRERLDVLALADAFWRRA